MRSGDRGALPSARPGTAYGLEPRLRQWTAMAAAGRVDIGLAALLAACTFLVHDVAYMLSAPLWLDETWVAISTRLPLSDIGRATSATPIGWSLLLRLVSFGGDQRLRMLPLLFAALTVIAAYGYARSLPWRGVGQARLAAVLAGSAALLIPSSLARNDLKQYTCDAFVTVVILWCGSSFENSRSGFRGGVVRKRLAALVVVVCAGFLFSAVSAFAGAAALGCILAVALAERRWCDARWVAAFGGGTGAVLVVIFLVFYRPGLPPGLNSYWDAYYLPVGSGWGASWSYLLTHGRAMSGFLGTGPLWAGVLTVGAGVVTLVRLGRTTTATVVPALLAIMILLGALKQYPLIDERTSYFLTTALAVTASIGVAGICGLLGRIHPSGPVVAAALVLMTFTLHVGPGFRSRNLPREDLRTPTAYISEHFRPGDMVVVAMLSSWGFAYYWAKGTPAIREVSTNLQGYVTVFPDQPDIIVTTDRTPAAARAAIDQAVAAAGAAGVPAVRIWEIHQHATLGELDAFGSAAKAHGLDRRELIPGSLGLLTGSPPG